MNDIFVVPLTKGHFAIVDAEDASLVAERKWQASSGNGRKVYAVSGNYPSKHVRMHRVVTSAPDGLMVDHINGATLDNRKRNLRVCTQAENARNRPRIDPRNTSGYRGVTWDKGRERWVAQVSIDRSRIQVGRYLDPVEAAVARDIAAMDLAGEFTNLNFPELANVFSTEPRFSKQYPALHALSREVVMP